MKFIFPTYSIVLTCTTSVLFLLIVPYLTYICSTGLSNEIYLYEALILPQTIIHQIEPQHRKNSSYSNKPIRLWLWQQPEQRLNSYDIVAQLFEPPAPIIGSPSCSIGPPDGDPAVLYISRFQAKLVAERTREGGESDRHIDADHTNAVATTTHPAPLPRNQKKKKALSSRREKTFRPLSNDGFLERGDGGGRRVPLGPDVGAVRQPELDLKLLLHAAGHLRAPPTPADDNNNRKKASASRTREYYYYYYNK